LSKKTPSPGAASTVQNTEEYLINLAADNGFDTPEPEELP
jgi:hypothetical protein